MILRAWLYAIVSLMLGPAIGNFTQRLLDPERE